jgi:DhnA family fructose-bisphosphate aldolase class Ia
MPGSPIRTDRLFDRTSGRSFMVAIDRTVSVGPEPFAEQADALISAVVAGGADAILMSPGLIKQHGHLAAFRGGPALVARIDFPFMYTITQGEGEEFRLIASLEEAVGLGADAVVMFLTGATQ